MHRFVRPLQKFTQKFNLYSTKQIPKRPTLRQSFNSLPKRTKLLLFSGLVFSVGAGVATPYILIESYKKDPLNSTLDKLLRKWYKGSYRDYMYIENGVVGEGAYHHVNPTFKFYIPKDYFIPPGVLVRDDQDEKGGVFMIEDDYGNYLSCSWLNNVIIDDKDEKTKISFLRSAFEDTWMRELEKEGSKIKWVEEVNTQTMSSSLSRMKLPPDVKGCPSFLFVVHVNENKFKNPRDYFGKYSDTIQPSNAVWSGVVLFMWDKTIFAVETRYPNSVLNYAIKREEMKIRGEKESELDDNTPKRAKELIENASFEHEDIIQWLRNELFTQHFPRSFKLDNDTNVTQNHIRSAKQNQN